MIEYVRSLRDVQNWLQEVEDFGALDETPFADQLEDAKRILEAHAVLFETAKDAISECEFELNQL